MVVAGSGDKEEGMVVTSLRRRVWIQVPVGGRGGGLLKREGMDVGKRRREWQCCYWQG